MIPISVTVGDSITYCWEQHVALLEQTTGSAVGWAVGSRDGATDGFGVGVGAGVGAGVGIGDGAGVGASDGVIVGLVKPVPGLNQYVKRVVIWWW